MASTFSTRRFLLSAFSSAALALSSPSHAQKQYKFAFEFTGFETTGPKDNRKIVGCNYAQQASEFPANTAQVFLANTKDLQKDDVVFKYGEQKVLITNQGQWASVSGVIMKPEFKEIVENGVLQGLSQLLRGDCRAKQKENAASNLEL